MGKVFEKVKDFAKSAKAKVIGGALAVAGSSSVLGIVAHASEGGGESTNSSITTAMTSAFSTAVADMLSAISAIVPVLLPVIGAVALVYLGIRLFRRVTGR